MVAILDFISVDTCLNCTARNIHELVHPITSIVYIVCPIHVSQKSQEIPFMKYNFGINFKATKTKTFA